MPETTERYHRVPNPAYSGEDFSGTERTRDLSAEQGISAVWAQLERSGQWKIRTFLFDRIKWAEMGDCQDWVARHREKFAASGATMLTMDMAIGFEQRQSAVPSALEFEKIRPYLLDSSITPDDLYVREMRLTNDQWSNSNMLRLSRGFLRSVMADMPGKALLLGHPEARELPAVPEGLFFDSSEERDSDGVTWGRAKFYMVRTASNEGSRAQIDAGVWRYASIGVITDWHQCSICGENLFSAACKHVPGQSYLSSEVRTAELSPVADPGDPSKVKCGAILRGQGKALEGSIVYWPELRGTQIAAEAQIGPIRGDLGAAKAQWLSGTGPLVDDDDEATGPVGSGESGMAGEPTEDTSRKEDTDQMNEDTKKLEEQLSASEGKAAELEASLKAAAEKAEALEKTLASVTASEAALRGAVVEDVKRLAALTKRDTELAAFAAAFGDDLASMPADKLLGLQSGWSKILDETMPGGRQSTPTERDPATGDAPGDKPSEGPTTFAWNGRTVL